MKLRSRSSLRLVAVSVVVLSVASPAALAAKTKHTPNGCSLVKKPSGRKCIQTDVEAWYNTETSALPLPTPIPTTGLPAVSPYDDRTLHAGVTQGQEDSRTFLTFDTSSLGYSALPDGGTLIVPIDPAASSGVKGAHLQMCYVAEPPKKSDEGSLDQTPKVDCSIQSDADYHKKPQPYVSFDLKPFASFIASGGGVALMATGKAADQQETWHLETYAKKNSSKDAVTIAALVKVERIDTSAPFDPGVTGGATGGPIGGSIGSGSNSGGLSSGSSGGFSIGSANGGSAAPANNTGQTAASGSQPSPVALPLVPVAAVRYPGVWVVPLALLIGAGFFGFALTRDVILRRS